MIFEYLDYVAYLKKYIELQPNHGRGLKAAIAETLKCKPSFISQVLAGKADFNSEQAFLLSEFLKHSESESRYFLLQVQYARASLKSLKDHYKKELQQMQSEELRLKNKFNYSSLRKEDQFQYFSSIDYSLVHILTTIPEFQTKDKLLLKTNLSSNRLESVLNYLLQLGLLEYKNNRYVTGNVKMHLPDDAAIISTVHTNWRVNTIKNVQSPNKEDLHYSSIVSINRNDFLKIKQILVKSIEDSRKNIQLSKNEEIACSFCVDFYEIK